MDRNKLPEYVLKGLPKLDNMTIISKQFTMAFLMNVGLTITFTGMGVTGKLEKYTNFRINNISHFSNLQLNSYLLGYVFAQIPAAICSFKFNPLIFFGRTILVYSTVLFVVTLLIQSSLGYLIVFKFLEGILLGSVVTIFYAAWKNWTLAKERSTLLSFASSGCYLGVLLGEILAEYSAELISWVYTVAIIGTLGIVWWFAWESMVYETPNKHRTISEKEHNYLHPTIRREIEQSEDLPCSKIIFSLPFLAILIVNFSMAWNSSFYLYDKDHMVYVHLIKVITFPLAGYFADVLVRITKLSTTQVRKLYITSVLMLEAVYFFLTLCFNVYDSPLYYISFGMHALHILAYSAATVNAVDIAPNHAGVTIAIINIASTIGYQLPFRGESSLQEIDMLDIFNKTSILAHLLGGIFYAYYGSAEPILPKNDSKDDAIKKEIREANNV